MERKRIGADVQYCDTPSDESTTAFGIGRCAVTIEQMLARKRELGYTYEMIAEKSGVPVSTVQKILGGFTETPRYDTLLALEGVLGYKDQYPNNYMSGTMCSGDAQLRESGRFAYTEERGYSTGLSRRCGGIDAFMPQEYIPDKRQGEYTVSDMDLLPEDVRAELIDGVIYDMASPQLNHQRAVLQVAYQIEKYIEENGGLCEVFISPADVRLDCDEKTSVQPDVFVVCDDDKLDEKRVNGAPDLCVEVLSPSTEKKDKWVKLNKYKTSGVREYWLIDCENDGVLCYDYMHGKFEIYNMDDKVPVAIYDGKLEIDFVPVARKLRK